MALDIITISEERGDFIAGDDGFYMFWPAGTSYGGFSADNLRTLATELDLRNADWETQIEYYFTTQALVDG